MLVHIPPFNGSIFNTALAPWITSFNVITAGTNIIATGKNRGQFAIECSTNTCAVGLIAYSIWHVNHQVSDLIGGNRLSPVIVIVIESGAIYAFSVSGFSNDEMQYELIADRNASFCS